MAGRNPHEAFENFRHPLQRALSCVNEEAHLWALSSNGYSPGQDHALVPNRGELVDLLSEQEIKLTSLFTYRVEKAEGERGPWKVKTTAYLHALEDGQGREIIAYHWHPAQGSAHSFPHLHIETGIGANLGRVHKYHIPTGRVAFEDVLRLAMNEFGVEAQRPDWDNVIGQTQAKFEQWRTWTGSGQPSQTS